LTNSRHLKLSLTLLLLAPASIEAQRDGQWLSSRVSEWYETTARSAPGEWGIAIADQSGRMLWSMNPDYSLMPASAVKLFTTGYAHAQG
jgi:hypothetical protein